VKPLTVHVRMLFLRTHKQSQQKLSSLYTGNAKSWTTAVGHH